MDANLAWNPHDVELSVAANGLSLMMPYVEPYIADSIEAAVEHRPAQFTSELLVDAERFIREERAHQRTHRRYNDRLVAAAPALRHVERAMSWVYGWFGRRRSSAFNVAFAASSETVAFSIARWAAANLQRFASPADPDVVRMFFWHLNEEIGHKSVAHDVWAATGRRRGRYLLSALVTLALVLIFVGWASIVQLGRRVLNPLTLLRLAAASVSVAFEVLPTLAASAWAGHDPRRLVDPVGLTCVR